MAKKLYSVTVERRFKIFVMADEKEDALNMALTNADDESENNDIGWSAFGATPVDSIEQVPPDWRGSIPWGEEDDRSVRMILDGVSWR